MISGEWLDSSKIEEFKLCPRKYYYRHELDLIPDNGEDDWATPMQFGTAIHAGLASFYDDSAFQPSTCPCPTYEGCEFCKGKPIARVMAQFLINYPKDPDDPKDPRTRNRGLELLAVYIAKYRREGFKVVAVETPFAIPFDGFTYIGKIDLLVLEDEKLKPFDHKTASRFGDQFQQQFKLSAQVTGYMHGVAVITKTEVFEAGINALRTTTKIDEDSLMRLTTQRSPEEFDEWKRETVEAFNLIKHYREQKFWPKHAPFSCSAYNRTCEYYGLCINGEQTRQTMIENAYRKLPWIPHHLT